MALTGWQLPQQLWDISGNLQTSLLGVFQSLQQYLSGLFAGGDARVGTAAPAGIIPIIQAATSVGTTDASGNLTVDWPQPFPNGLVACVPTDGDSTATPNMVVGISKDVLPTLTTVLFKCTSGATAAAVASTLVRVDWIAIGW